MSKLYVFTLSANGYGENEEEAWANACEAMAEQFSEGPGEYDTVKLVDDNTEIPDKEGEEE